MKTKMKTLALAATAIALLALTGLTHAQNNRQGGAGGNNQDIGHSYNQPEKRQDQGRGPGNGPPGREPPPEAIEACEGKNEGDKVEFETPHGDIVKGSCMKKDDLLFAVPENGQRPPRGGERQEGGGRRR